MKKYEHKAVEKKWQLFWDKNKIYTTPDKAPGKDNFYLLVEFPYPSGNLHVGHWYSFAVPDIFARTIRMQGKNVLYPIGFDAFGLPAENAAIKNKLNPRTWTEKNIAYMTKQLRSMGASFDWSRAVSTIDPSYYKWTQWMFLQFFKNGLVYQKETAVNWCPKDKTVLANEQVEGGKCERCDSEVVQRQMLQWNIKITKYADRLIDDLAPLEWPEQIKESQRNWIGRSEGAEIDFALAGNVKDDSRFLLLHGKHSSSKSDFHPWLKAELEKRGYEVETVDMPNPEEPSDREQADFVEKHCTLDERTVIVGHSFGGVVALRLLERGHKVRRVVLVATPFSGKWRDGQKRPSVTAAVKKGFDFNTIKKNARVFMVVPDANDPIVPSSDPDAYVQNLDAPLYAAKANAPHLTGAQEPDVLMMCVPTIRVFTTRPDTLYGATYLVLAPEHPWLNLALANKGAISNEEEISRYIAISNKKTDLERQENKDKSGVKLEGVDAINPATGEKIPLFVADYVLGHYGTGAIMAVPAHDERDFEFAKKHSLPVRNVIEPLVIARSGADKFREDIPAIDRSAIMAIIKHWSEDKYLCLNYKLQTLRYFVSGGIEQGETPVAAAMREIREETGYTNLRLERELGTTIHSYFYQGPKQQNTRGHFVPLFFRLEDGSREEVSEREKSLHDVMWIDADKVSDFISCDDVKIAWKRANGDECYTGNGILFGSGEFSGLTSEEAIPKIGEKFGRMVKQYRLRDWIVSRQRYWGVPIPIIHCPACGAVPVPDKDLPVKLPNVKDYLPEGSGKSPLAKVKSFVNVKCPKCKGKAQRETDTLDTFVDSSWYFLRYTDPKNRTKFADPKKMGKWMPVDLYSGGAEHTTMHLLYSRFWHKALYDLKLVKDPEPYAHRMNRSIILGPDGQKMSKSHGNVIDPDEVVARLGADTVRMYLAFIGPYNEVSNFPWNPDGVVGVRRFLERVWRVGQVPDSRFQIPDNAKLESLLHKTIKKVGDDVAALKFNTAISQLMIFLNALEKEKQIGKKQWEHFLKLLAPFAPHMAEELWHECGNKRSIHTEKWPKSDPALCKDETVTIAVQINGKTRAEASVPAGASKETLENVARHAVSERLSGKEVSRVIIVPGRLVNFVASE